MSKSISTNTFGVAKWVVSPDATQGTHTTMTAAMASASPGDTIFVRSGRYTESWTLKTGITVQALGSPNLGGNVFFDGTITYAGGGDKSSIIGCEFLSQGAPCILFNGSVAGTLYILNCSMQITDGNAVSFTNSSANSSITFDDCSIDIANTGITLFTSSSVGLLQFKRCIITNSGSSTTPSTASSGAIFFKYTACGSMVPMDFTGTAIGLAYFSSIETATTNVPIFTFAGSNLFIQHCYLASGTASAVIVNSPAVCLCTTTVILSTNANPVSGTGTLDYGDLTFLASSQVDPGLTLSLSGSSPSNAISGYVWTSTGTNTSPTWQAVGATGAISQVVIQTFSTTGTYTPTAGMKYCVLEVCGGGGGGGGAAPTGATDVGAAGGGGAGGYARIVASAATIGASQAVTIGAGGTGGSVAGGNGGNGGATSIGAICVAAGGIGGTGETSGTNVVSFNPGGAGGSGTTGTVLTTSSSGSPGWGIGTAQVVVGGAGGGGPFGGAGQGHLTGVPSTAGSNGGGGGGSSLTVNVGTGLAGSAGGAGIVIVTEYL